MKHYAIRKHLSGGNDWYHCKHCKRETMSLQEMLTHLEVTHQIIDPDAPAADGERTVEELREIARSHGLAVRGTKAELIQRLDNAGVL